MNISYNWLKEYVNFDLTPDEDLYRSDIYLSLTELTRIISLKEKSVLI